MTATQANIAADYQSLIDDVIATVERCSDEQWRASTAPEQWSVGVVAHHIANTQLFVIESIQNVVNGSETLPQIKMEQVHAGNAQHAREFADVGKEETLSLLQEGAPRAIELIQGLTEGQLDAAAGSVDGYGITLRQCIDSVALSHFREHLASIKETVRQ
jgi:uncharacterized damage-inducible protein DinB